MRVNIKNYKLGVCGIHIEGCELRWKSHEFNKTSSYFYNKFVVSSVQEFVSQQRTRKIFRGPKNQGIAESSSLVGGGWLKFSDWSFVGSCRTSYTPYQFDFQRQRQSQFIDTQKIFSWK